jgi:tetratricopeptide (TPR) repeat protein
VQVEFLRWIVEFGGEVAGALVGLSDRELARHLERLKSLGLVFRYETDQRAVYSAHPFLREYFRNLLTAKPETIHESVRARLAASFDLKSKTNPRDSAILDQYESLIEQTLLAGNAHEAFRLYQDALGGYKNLGGVLGDYARGLRVLERFVPEDDFSRARQLPFDRPWIVVNDLGCFARNLGDLGRARRAFAYCQRLVEAGISRGSEPVNLHNLIQLELNAGHFWQSLEYSEKAISLTSGTDRLVPFSYRATSHFILGNVTEALADFQRATVLNNGMPLLDAYGVPEAECKFLRGYLPAALSQTEASREFASKNNSYDAHCICNILLARILVPDDPVRASTFLLEASKFANRSGSIELQLRYFQAACELHLHLGDYPQGIAKAEAGILLADTCDYGWWSINLRIVLAETLLGAGGAGKALQSARNALDRSEQPGCEYAWGKADSLHFCGLAHLQLGERELGCQRLTAALELRERLGHGRVEETRRALAACRP